MATGSLVSLNSSAKVYEKKEPHKNEVHKGTERDRYWDKTRYFSRLFRDTLGHLPAIAGFFEVLSGEGKFGLCVWVNKFGFSVIADIG